MQRIITHTQRVLKRIDRGLSGPIVEFSEQFLYGHREILMNHAGFSDVSMIKGSIEHGWALQSGKGIRRFPTGRYLYLSWGEERIRRSKMVDPMTIAIGAPFLYAHGAVKESLDQFEAETRTRSRRTLFFPVHGNEFIQQNAESQVQLFTEHYSPSNSTVCLYWVEYVNPQIYNYYKSLKFNIVCSGFSGQMEHTGLGYSARRLAGSPIGGRPNFILNTIAMFANYENIVFGGIGTGLFYASYMRRNITVLHKYLNTSYLDMDHERGNSYDKNVDEMYHVNYIAQYLQCSFSEIAYNSEKFKELTNQELGVSSLRSPTELKELLEPHITNSANPQSMHVYKNSINGFTSILNSYKESAQV